MGGFCLGFSWEKGSRWVVLYNKKNVTNQNTKNVYNLDKGIFNEGIANDIFPLL